MALFKKVVMGALVAAVVGFSGVGHADEYYDGVKSAMKQDYQGAFDRFMPLAKQGDGRALFNLALMYHGGLFVEFDEAQAVSLYQEAAQKGVVEARQFLAVAYEEGWFGLPQDKKQSEYWYSKIP